MNKGVPRLATTVVAIGAVALELALAGCGTGGGDTGGSTPKAGGDITGEVSLQTWALTPKFTSYLNDVIKGFEAKYPGTKVNLLDQPGDGYSDKVLSQAASGTLPDVVNLPPDFALPLVKKDLLLDVSKADDKLADTYVPGGLDAFKFNGFSGTYGYPWYLNTDVDYWNIDKFGKCGLDAKNPPKTTDDLFAQAKIMHDTCGGQEYLMSRKPGIGDFTRAGIKILSDDGKKFVFNTPKAADLLDKYKAAFAAGYLPNDVLNSDYLGNSKLFTQGKVAWSTGGATSLADFEKDNPSLKGKVLPTPALDLPPLYVQGLSVSGKSVHQATAIALAQWVTNADNQLKFAHLVNIFPSTKSSQSDPFFAQSDGTPAGDAKVLASKELSTARNIQPYEVNQAMSDYTASQIALAMKGDVPSQQALDDIVKKLNDLLAKG